jgi:hypothetical protein
MGLPNFIFIRITAAPHDFLNQKHIQQLVNVCAVSGT